MKKRSVKNIVFILVCMVLPVYANKIAAQTLKYCSENVFISNPDNLQLVANIDGNHHLLSFSKNENPELFIFNSALEFKTKITLPFKFQEKSIVKIIPFGKFYYLQIHPWLSQKDFLWKIDSDGNCVDYAPFFQKLLASQSHNIKLGFQLMPYKNSLLMVYHTALDNIDKNTVIIVETDSLLNPVFTNKVVYDFKRDEEKLEKEVLLFGKYLLVLKTSRSGTALEAMKINLATSYAISNIFTSSGYFYSQSSLSINNGDSSFAVSALLTQPRTSPYVDPKQFVFVSKLNKFLVQEIPFVLLKDQFTKNTGTNFVLVNGRSEWMKFRRRGDKRNSSGNVYRNLTTAENNADVMQETEPKEIVSGSPYSWDAYGGIRFSLLNKELEIVNDSLVKNTKDYYTLRADQFLRFKYNQKEYMILGQQFVKKSRGLIMMDADDENNIRYTDLRIVDRNDYLLHKSCLVPGEGIIIPYVHKLEAGLVKIGLN